MLCEFTCGFAKLNALVHIHYTYSYQLLQFCPLCDVVLCFRDDCSTCISTKEWHLYYLSKILCYGNICILTYIQALENFDTGISCLTFQLGNDHF